MPTAAPNSVTGPVQTPSVKVTASGLIVVGPVVALSRALPSKVVIVVPPASTARIVIVIGWPAVAPDGSAENWKWLAAAAVTGMTGLTIVVTVGSSRSYTVSVWPPVVARATLPCA